MLNFRLLYVLLRPRSVQTFLGICALIGLGVIVDVVIFLRLSLLVGPWITMALLSANTAAGIFFMFRHIETQGERLIEAVDNGRFVPGMFSRYLSSLLASLFLIIPGLLNSVAGLFLLIPYPGEKCGNLLARQAGIDWQEAYEYLRLDRITGNQKGDFAQG